MCDVHSMKTIEKLKINEKNSMNDLEEEYFSESEQENTQIFDVSNNTTEERERIFYLMKNIVWKMQKLKQ